ncbi:MAG: 2-oxoacid:acceptor oxidoreductase family protein [Syntrophobacteria bacterium]
MRNDRANLQFCGFGGQGIVLSAVIFGTAAVTQAGLNGVQTQSYGSEARGGQCQAELILSERPLNSPLADQVDILVVMSQSALDRYLDRLRSGGTLILDPELVERPKRSDIKIIEVPATQTASEIGPKIVANMVMLGFLQQATGLISEEDLLEAIRSSVRPKFLEADLKAAKRGIALAKDQSVKVEV